MSAELPLDRSATRVLVTGGSGFIGKHLLSMLARRDLKVSVAQRSTPIEAFQCFILGDFDKTTNWSEAVAGQDVVVHCAGRAHITSDGSERALEQFREVNTYATAELARQAAQAGVRRFIFLSSIGVLGNTNSMPFRPTDPPAPIDDYAMSKLEAEQALKNIQRSTGMEVVIIRPPLVYGPSAPGNFGLISRIVRLGVPLPLARVNNVRSLVSVWNLVDLIAHCVDHPAANKGVWLVRDGEDVSTAELIRLVADANGIKAPVFPMPPNLLAFCARLIGKQLLYEKLVGSLRLDDSKTRDSLGWVPPMTLREGIARCF